MKSCFIRKCGRGTGKLGGRSGSRHRGNSLRCTLDNSCWLCTCYSQENIARTCSIIGSIRPGSQNSWCSHRYHNLRSHSCTTHTLHWTRKTLAGTRCIAQHGHTLCSSPHRSRITRCPQRSQPCSWCIRRLSIIGSEMSRKYNSQTHP